VFSLGFSGSFFYFANYCRHYRFFDIMKAKYIGKIEDGRLRILNKRMFDAHIESLNGKEVSIILDKNTKKRSNNQNAYYHGVVLPIVKAGLIDAGFENYRNNEQVHDLLKFRFLKTNESNTDGEFIERIKSTSELSTSQFMDFIAEVQQWATEFLNVYIPEPNENLELNL
jgi:hypothetical protein